MHGLSISGLDLRVLVRHLVDNLNVEVLALDQINHGKSVAGRLMDVPSGDLLWRSQSDFIRFVKEETRMRDLPAFCYGCPLSLSLSLSSRMPVRPPARLPCLTGTGGGGDNAQRVHGRCDGLLCGARAA